MTTLAMIFGMVPLAFALTEGSEQRAPMGQAVIGGVITSSLLTLVVVPVVYCYLDDLAQLGAAPLARRAEAGAPAAATEPLALKSKVCPEAPRHEEENTHEPHPRPWSACAST